MAPQPSAVAVWAWGSNNRGQLGTGDIAYSNVPKRVRGLPPDIVAIAAGGSHILALQSTGAVWAWGNNDSGQLGVHPHVCRTELGHPIDCATLPVRVRGLPPIQAISAGTDDSLALAHDGTVWNWGANGTSQLGSDPAGQAATVSRPTRIPRLAHVVAINTSGANSAALLRDGTVWAWGDGQPDASYLGTTQSDPAGPNGPAPVPGLVHVTAVAVADEHFLALRTNGTVAAWGFDRDGELGIGYVDADYPHRPMQVHGLRDVVAIAARGTTSLALRRDGTVWTWGDRVMWPGGGGTHPTPLPVQVTGVRQVRAIDQGEQDDAAVEQDGSLWLWGANDAGQLGIGGHVDGSTAPVRVLGLHGIIATSLGYNASFAVQQQ